MAITHEMYQALLGDKTLGRARKSGADMLMKSTWLGDLQAQTAYLYDYTRDMLSPERLKLSNLTPYDDQYKTSIPIKFIRHQSQTYDKDQVTFWIQLLPGQECNVDYYDEVLGKRYDALFPIGLYIDIQHEDGSYNKWLIVDRANYNGLLFPTFEILRCDKVFQWVFDNKKYECSGVLRSQNSYVCAHYI